MKNKQVRFIAEMGIFIALGLVLDLAASFYSNVIWPNGGSISFAMVPIFIMSFRYGLKGGLISGFAVGTIQIIWAGSGIVHWIQVILDYSIAYAVIGLAGIASKQVLNKPVKQKVIYANVTMFLVCVLRTFIHTISGYVFFKDSLSANGMSSNLALWIASFTYNIGYMLPSTILSMIVITILIVKYFYLIKIDNIEEKNI